MRQVNRLTLLAIILLASCGDKQTLSPNEYMSYFSAGKTANKVESGSLSYEVRLITPEFVALRDATNSTTGINRQTALKRLALVKENLYFFIKLPSVVNESKDKTALIDYYNYKIKPSIKLITNDNPIGFSPEYVQYEDNYGLAPTNTLIVCFNKNLSSFAGGCKFSFDDMPNNNPALTVSYSRDFINHLPILSL